MKNGRESSDRFNRSYRHKPFNLNALKGQKDLELLSKGIRFKAKLRDLACDVYFKQNAREQAELFRDPVNVLSKLHRIDRVDDSTRGRILRILFRCRWPMKCQLVEDGSRGAFATSP